MTTHVRVCVTDPDVSEVKWALDRGWVVCGKPRWEVGSGTGLTRGPTVFVLRLPLTGERGLRCEEGGVGAVTTRVKFRRGAKLLYGTVQNNPRVSYSMAPSPAPPLTDRVSRRMENRR